MKSDISKKRYQYRTKQGLLRYLYIFLALCAVGLVAWSIVPTQASASKYANVQSSDDWTSETSVKIYNGKAYSGGGTQIYLPLIINKYPQKIAFVVYSRIGSEIYTQYTNGSGLSRVTYTSCWELNLTWSPDGTQLASDCQDLNNGQVNFTIYVMNADGSGFKQLTDSVLDSREPSWSPDGRKIAFISNRNTGSMWEIYFMNPDGSQQTVLAVPGLNVTSLDWSPDSKQLVFSAIDSLSSTVDIYKIKTDGTGLVRLTNNRQHARYPDWSHDGSRIIFSDNYWDIYIMNSDGSDLLLVAQGVEPSWSPDDRTIAYLVEWSSPDIFPIFNLWLVKPDGTEPAPVTSDFLSRFGPKWFPGN